MPLVPINEKQYNIEVALKYGTLDNFTNDIIYKNPKLYLLDEAAEALQRASSLAQAMGYKLLVWDGYRPLAAAQKLWDAVPDPRFVSRPDETGPLGHARGVAVDLTLVDEHGQPLDMGTAFDAFTELSYHKNTEVSVTVQKNRFMLLGLMKAAGWDFITNEWWHYQLPNLRSYPLVKDQEIDSLIMGECSDASLNGLLKSG